MKRIAKIQPTLYSWAGENLSTGNTHTVGMTAVTDEATGSVSYTANRMYLHFDMPVLPNNCQTQKAELILTQINSTDEATVTPKLALFPVTTMLLTIFLKSSVATV